MKKLVGAMPVTLHEGDLPLDLSFSRAVAIDTETSGLNPWRDPLRLVQLSGGDGTAHLVRISARRDAPNLSRVLGDPEVEKIFHFARFDMAALQRRFGVVPSPVFCTKIASKLARTYTDRHGLKDLVREFLRIDLAKESQSSDWAAENLSAEQIDYAAADVLYLHGLRDKLADMLERDGRLDLARKCFAFLPTCCALDLAGWRVENILSHG